MTRVSRATRVQTQGARITFADVVQGSVTQDVEHAVGDFVVARADGLIAYQLAVVVDDAAQGVTDVVRGADLLDSTPRQILLQQLLGLPMPRYMHLPVAVNAQGEKLSKQTLAPPLDPQQPSRQLAAALRFLGQAPPVHLQQCTPPRIWDWAITHWQSQRIPAQRTVRV